MADAALAETIVKMMRAQLAECEEMIALGVAPPGTAEHVDMIRTLLATFTERKPPNLPKIQVLARGERGREWGSAKRARAPGVTAAKHQDQDRD